jgi:hypothetical protein
MNMQRIVIVLLILGAFYAVITAKPVPRLTAAQRAYERAYMECASRRDVPVNDCMALAGFR